MPHKKPAEPAPTYRCDGTWRDPQTSELIRCMTQVASRRPSSTGTHWCPEKRCQAAKQRYYRSLSASRAATQAVDEVGDEVKILIRDLIDNQRSDCHACGLTDALVGWAHRAGPDLRIPCYALGNKGNLLPPGTLGMINRGAWPRA